MSLIEKAVMFASDPFSALQQFYPQLNICHIHEENWWISAIRISQQHFYMAHEYADMYKTQHLLMEVTRQEYTMYVQRFYVYDSDHDDPFNTLQEYTTKFALGIAKDIAPLAIYDHMPIDYTYRSNCIWTNPEGVLDAIRAHQADAVN